MSIASLYSRAQVGVDAPLVSVEVHLSNGLPKFNMVGLPEKTVKESKDRVRSAIINSGFRFPQRHLTVNLAPADIPKEGCRFDLAIAIGILIASKQLACGDLKQIEFLGELALTGELRGVRATLPIAVACQKSNRQLILPFENLNEACLVDGIQALPAKTLLGVFCHLDGSQQLCLQTADTKNEVAKQLDLIDIHGQHQAKRALEIAAAGGHSLLMTGPPGTGKTMLANRLPGILPPLNTEQAMQVATIYSISRQGFCAENWKQRPFRQPHHTASSVALVGGSSPPKPGEISLAHQGILFLDELPEFDRRVLETLREPLESKKIIIARAGHHVTFPADFQLIAAMNPCPCGYLTNPRIACRCTPAQIQRYHQRLSGPFLDRIDLHIEVAMLDNKILLNKPAQNGESSQQVLGRVIKSREIQQARGKLLNYQLQGDDLQAACQINSEQRDFLNLAMEKFNLSMRAYQKILKVARTIADLDECMQIEKAHLTEAISYRKLESATAIA